MEGFSLQDVDVEMTALIPRHDPESNPDTSDEVESLGDSLRDAVHDVNVRPKMQCLMMDSSFSMVTVQGEDSGIAWETTPSGCTTPWPSENPAADLSFPTSPTPLTHPAGKIIFEMDEGILSRGKKLKEKSRAERPPEVLGGSVSNIPGRPELVEFSQPNVKGEEGDGDEPNDPLEEKEQQLFSLVSEGSEILNIVVPPKLASVDEEESKTMEDNLSYLEERPPLRGRMETEEMETLIPVPRRVLPSVTADGMDPPGAPVAKPRAMEPVAGNVDYFQAFSLMEAEAPGAPAALLEQVEPDDVQNKDAEEPPPSEDPVTRADAKESDTLSLLGIPSQLLDEVFYGHTDSHGVQSLDGSRAAGETHNTPNKVPSKTSGSNLFGSQEDILTPIFLPEGPPKIIDPILLEEPKAMSFLYTDLYEEALGSRTKEEDTTSMTSEKSFHSRHSDREARGYLEKFVLIDETPVLEAEQPTSEKQPSDQPRTLTQDLYEFGDFLASTENLDRQSPEEEITDFFRSSGNSSPCDVEPFPRSVEEVEVPKAKSSTKTVKDVCIKVSEPTAGPLEASSELCPTDADGDHYSHTLDDEDVTAPPDLEPCREPVPPPRRKVASSPKSRLDLMPLTPVEVMSQNEGGASGKEQREEEKETASPVETADEGDGCADEVIQDLYTEHEAECSLTETSEIPLQQEGEERSAGGGDTDGEPERRGAEQPEGKEAEGEVVESKKQEQIPAEAAKAKTQCAIL